MCEEFTKKRRITLGGSQADIFATFLKLYKLLQSSEKSKKSSQADPFSCQRTANFVIPLKPFPDLTTFNNVWSNFATVPDPV